MRYKKIQVIRTTVCDEDISDVEDMRSLIDKFSKSHIDISLEYRDVQTDTPRRQERVRIKSIDDDDNVKIKVYFSSSIVNLTIQLKNITMLHLVTEKTAIMINNQNLNEFDLLDLT